MPQGGPSRERVTAAGAREAELQGASLRRSVGSGCCRARGRLRGAFCLRPLRRTMAGMPPPPTHDLLPALVLAQVLGGLLGWSLPVATATPLYALPCAVGVSVF